MSLSLDKKRWREEEEDKKEMKAEGEPDKKIKLESSISAPVFPAPVPPAVHTKKRRWGDVVVTDTQSTSAATTAGSGNTSSIQAALDKAKQAALLQKQLAERGVYPHPSIKNEQSAASASATPPTTTGSSSSHWIPLRLDAQGRQVDESGQVVQLKREATFKINQPTLTQDSSSFSATQRTSKKQQYTQQQQRQQQDGISTPSSLADTSTTQTSSVFFDPRMPSAPKERGERDLFFNKPGKYIAKAAAMRMKQLEQEMQIIRFEQHEREAMTQTSIIPEAETSADVPEREWWDEPFYTSTTTSTSDTEQQPQQQQQQQHQQQQQQQLQTDKITSYIYHPIPIQSLIPDTNPATMPMMLTRMEKKKLKRRQRVLQQKETSEKIRLGLIQPPPPKLRIRNLLDTLLSHTVADPSTMEATIRAQMKERQELHEATNAARKLSSEAKLLKQKKKYTEDTSKEVHVAVFIASDLSHPQIRYKIDINAQQWQLTGVAVLVQAAAASGREGEEKSDKPTPTTVNVIVVEGGPKNVQRMIRLMTQRIKWNKKYRPKQTDAQTGEDGNTGPQRDATVPMQLQNERDDDDDEDDEEADGSKRCLCVWQGVRPKPAFERFGFEVCRSAVQARSVFAKAGVEQYFDLARNYHRQVSE